MSRLIDAILPSFSSNTEVITASTKFSPIAGAGVRVTIGFDLYPKPCVSKLIDATANPRVAVAVAPDPVVSPVAAAIDTVGTQLYSMAGDSSDPGGFYYIAATMHAEGGTAGTMSFSITYAVN